MPKEVAMVEYITYLTGLAPGWEAEVICQSSYGNLLFFLSSVIFPIMNIKLDLPGKSHNLIVYYDFLTRH